jgi:hypothetical protein
VAAAERYAASEHPTPDDLRLLNLRLEDIHAAMFQTKEASNA